MQVAAEERADTIVVGNRGAHGTWWRVRDSVPNLVLRHAPCSVFMAAHPVIPRVAVPD